MKQFSPSKLLRSRFPLAILAGIVLAAAFPKFGIAGFAWIAPGLFLAVALGKRGGKSFRTGYVAGLAQYLVSLSWLLNIPYTWHGIPFGPAAGLLALSAFLALFPATWVWLSMRSLSTPGNISTTWLDALRDLYGQSWSRRISWALFSAALWITLELLLTHIFGGFPWILLGNSQYRIVPLIQFASFTGVYGVSFLIVWTSLSFLCAAGSILARPTERSPWMAEIILPFVVIIVAFGYGMHQLRQPQPTQREVRVSLVQPSIPQRMIWDESKGRERFLDLMNLSEEALAQPADVLIWPEASLPGSPIDEEGNIVAPIAQLAQRHETSLIIGGDDIEIKPSATNYFNASFLVDPNGKLAARYHKRGLVIFGEYVPLENTLPFIKWLTPVTGSYTRGKGPVPFRIALHSSDSETNTPQFVQTSVLICFEDIFPNLGRNSVDADTDFLVNITNDGWFGEGAAQWQQAAAATFRTVENGVPLIRCANTGITCWIDANGRWQQTFADKNGSAYGAGFMAVTIPLPEKHPLTFYHQNGNLFAWGCMALVFLSLVTKELSPRFSKVAATTTGK